ncbi:MAG: hypothetical protein AAF721_09665 [Myxococcota bacterium]
MSEADELQDAKDVFIEQWGAMGSLWGVTRTMAQTHAALLAADEPTSTDDLMHELGISRGNANQTLRQLVEQTSIIFNNYRQKTKFDRFD